MDTVLTCIYNLVAGHMDEKGCAERTYMGTHNLIQIVLGPKAARFFFDHVIWFKGRAYFEEFGDLDEFWREMMMQATSKD